jgi:competence protein ComGC
MNRIGTIVMRVGYVVIILLLLVIAIPSFIPSRNVVSQNSCFNNLRMIDSAKESWAFANQKTNGDEVVTSEVNQYMRGNTGPRCPNGGQYSYNAVGVNPTCTVTNLVGHSLGKE